eukprot:TRINITY_DN9583_c0_g1_i1.p1 TRINITY_DN9583_c0_g1~~TRINITY_DN9583_c0_g1_i1.p1  ORF type:complete len:293 (-),score=39.43 TRINITY_DN9583_c0_g1_i1:52-930(-)
MASLPPRRSNRNQQTWSPSPTKPPSSPNSLGECFWFKYVRETIGLEEITFATCEDLGFTPKEEIAARRKGVAKRNWFIKDVRSGSLYIVKQSSNIERSFSEWSINEQLGKFNIPHTIPAVGWFQGREHEDMTEVFGFLIIPFIKSTTFASLCKRETPLSDLELLKGLEQIVEFLFYVDPSNLRSLQLLHKDIKPDQILYDSHNSKWYIIDFGLAEATYKARLDTGQEVIAIIISSSSASSGSEELKKIVDMFATEIQSEDIKKRLRTAAKQPSVVCFRMIQLLVVEEQDKEQ